MLNIAIGGDEDGDEDHMLNHESSFQDDAERSQIQIKELIMLILIL